MNQQLQPPAAKSRGKTLYSVLIDWASAVMVGSRPHRLGAMREQQGVARFPHLTRNRIPRDYRIVPGVGENIS